MLPQQFKLALDELARGGICIGTSSWKYPGWCGQLYDEQRYLTRGKLSEAKFERECLAEYAQTFSTVCVDAGYYHFPSEKWIGGLCAQVPDHFRFGFKVTDEITVKKFPNLPRFGSRAGTANSNFLNPELFERNFLNPLEPHRRNSGRSFSSSPHFTRRTLSMAAILWPHWNNSSAHFRRAGISLDELPEGRCVAKPFTCV